MITSSCPYCNEYNKSSFKVSNDSEIKKVKCSKCNNNYNVDIHLNKNSISDVRVLESIIPKNVIEMVESEIKAITGYKGKGGYENSRHIEIESLYEKEYSSHHNAFVITIYGKATYYQPEFRYVEFRINYNGDIDYKVYSEYSWRQSSWFVGETLQEKVRNYLNNALVKWEII